MYAQINRMGSDMCFTVFFFAAYVLNYIEETKFYSPLEDLMHDDIYEDYDGI